MTKRERYGNRDLLYSTWHRTLHKDLFMADIDGLEYCRHCYSPLALIEIARDIGQSGKKTRPLECLAKQADIPAYLAFYKGPWEEVEKELRDCTTARARVDVLEKCTGVTALRVRRLVPIRGREICLTPAQYELFLVNLRMQHSCYSNVPWHFWELTYMLSDMEKVIELCGEIVSEENKL